MSPVHYPKGVAPVAEKTPGKKTAAKRASAAKKVAPGNRGMSFEAGINETNAYYAEKGLCLVTKRPTPIKVVNVDYSKGATITNAFYEKQSTTDYNGVYQGRYLDFEAKETRCATSFPLANIPAQQIAHLEAVLAHGGIAFFLIHFFTRGETYLVPAKTVIEFRKAKQRASLPYETIKKEGTLVKEGFRPRFDYLSALREAFAL